MIKLLVTGGTFDKEYDEINGKLYFKDTHVNEMLRLGRCTAQLAVRTIMMIDSLEMTDDDRQIIINSCQNCDEQRIIITHGTDTICQTAQTLAQNATTTHKTIVLTGAIIPYKFGSSDGFFNLGAAIAFAQSLPEGVYIAMNGKAFEWDKVQKNKKTGFFEDL